MSTPENVSRLETGIPNLDTLFDGGIPDRSVLVIGGPPGAGKTILTQQLCFHNATPQRRVLYFNTLSEPTAKTLRFLQPFRFFDPKKLEHDIQFVDLGVMLRAKGLEETAKLILEHVRRVKPSIVVVDSFKVFDDLAKTHEELRKFGYELVVQLMAWETTVLLLGEYGQRDIETNPLFSIVDGLITVTQRVQAGEQQRFLQIVKMRGTDHSRDEQAFAITADGVQVFAPRATLQRQPLAEHRAAPRLLTGVSKLDDLLGQGIPLGSSLLVGGVAGTGKTVLLLEFLYRGAQRGEKGIIFSFEETAERLTESARGFGWDLEREIERGMVEIVFVAQPDILVERHLMMMRERVTAIGTKRVAVDSISVFLHKVQDAQAAREKVFQLASIVQNAQAVGLFATDIPYGTEQISRWGVEETVVDGVILLTAGVQGYDRQRYIEIYKLRNTAHLTGRHTFSIGQGGLSIYPRYRSEQEVLAPPPPVEVGQRLPSGVEGADKLLGGGLLHRSATLVSGSAGVGKTTLAIQFLLEGARHGESGLYFGLEEGQAQLLATAEELDLPLRDAVEKKQIALEYLAQQHLRAHRLLSMLEDRIRETGARRVVLDSVNRVATAGLMPDEQRQLLFGLVRLFKALDVTSLFTVESIALYSLETATDQAYSPISDNLLVLRYERAEGENVPIFQIVKTRGSAHDRGTYELIHGQGGLRVGRRVGAGALPKRRKGS